MMVSLRQVLQKLNPFMILEDRKGHRHRVLTWLRRIQRVDLRRIAFMDLDHYNNYRVEVLVHRGNGRAGSDAWFVEVGRKS